MIELPEPLILPKEKNQCWLNRFESVICYLSEFLGSGAAVVVDARSPKWEKWDCSVAEC